MLAVSSKLSRVIGGLLLVALGAPALPSAQNCSPGMLPIFDSAEGTSGQVNAACVFDDGSGPAMYVGGFFTTAGGRSASRVARWDGRNWSAVGEGFNSAVNALFVFDDGNGPRLYAGGAFTASSSGSTSYGRVARLEGTSWTPVGILDSEVLCFASFDSGTGPRLYAGGIFLGGIASWDGTAWNGPGGGVSGGVFDMCVHDDGTGPALYAGGAFGGTGTGIPANSIARWSGSSWSNLGAGVSGSVGALLSYDDGSGPALLVGGALFNAGGVPVPRFAIWKAGTWSPGPSLGASVQSVNDLCVADLGAGPRVFAVSAPAALHSLTASGWVNWGNLAGWFQTLIPFDEGEGTRLFVAGVFDPPSPTGPFFHNIVRYEPTGWQPVGNSIDGDVRSLAVHTTSAGRELFVGGNFEFAGSRLNSDIARWNGLRWSPIGLGADNVSSLGTTAMASFDDGSGQALYIGGSFSSVDGLPATRVARWDGTAWSAVGAGLPATPNCFAAFDDGSGPALFVGLSSAVGSTFMKWDGASWQDLTALYPIGPTAMRVWDDGSGPALYVGAYFGNFPGFSANGIAKWDGTTWTSLGSGLTGPLGASVNAIEVFTPAGGTPALYVGGEFTDAGGVAVKSLARWNGTSWSAVGAQLNQNTSSVPIVHALAATSVGGTPRLAVGGRFQSVGTGQAYNLALYNGSTWQRPVTSSAVIYCLIEHDDGSGPKLFLGGRRLGNTSDGGLDLYAWGCSLTAAGSTYCSSGTSATGCVPALGSTGSASASAASGFVLVGSGLDPNRPAMLYLGLNGGQSKPFTGSSLLCVRPPLVRTGVLLTSAAGGTCGATLQRDWNDWRATHPSAPGQPFVAGETVWAQAWCRDPLSPSGSVTTNGVVFVLAP